MSDLGFIICYAGKWKHIRILRNLLFTVPLPPCFNAAGAFAIISRQQICWRVLLCTPVDEYPRRARFRHIGNTKGNWEFRKWKREKHAKREKILFWGLVENRAFMLARRESCDSFQRRSFFRASVPRGSPDGGRNPPPVVFKRGFSGGKTRNPP